MSNETDNKKPFEPFANGYVCVSVDTLAQVAKTYFDSDTVTNHQKDETRWFIGEAYLAIKGAMRQVGGGTSSEMRTGLDAICKMLDAIYM